MHDALPMALEIFRVANLLTMLADAATHLARKRSLRAGEPPRACAREAKSYWIIESRLGTVRGLSIKLKFSRRGHNKTAGGCDHPASALKPIVDTHPKLTSDPFSAALGTRLFLMRKDGRAKSQHSCRPVMPGQAFPLTSGSAGCLALSPSEPACPVSPDG